MVADTLVDRKVEASERLASELIRRGSPLLAAYWEFKEDRDRWSLTLVPSSPHDEMRLISEATALLVEDPFQAALSLFDLKVDGRQIERARALGGYIRVVPYVGRRIDSTFTDGQYFESVVPVYLASELMTHLSAA